jgi:succinoglycan biosynthesis protein ExoM
MAETRPHISVCICTYKRPDSLKRLLKELGIQDTGGLFTYSIVVADNDCLRSAQRVVAAFAAESPIAVTYWVEPQQGIARARNTAVRGATGEFVAFIDDDEFPTEHWLRQLLTTLRQYKVDGVLGPVKPHFAVDAPKWVRAGGFYDRPLHPTGLLLKWSKCRTGNVLLERQLFAENSQPFGPEFLQGEDQDFFKRMIAKGHKFIWCNEAAVYEVVPPARWKRSFLVKRAVFRGMFSLRNSGFSPLRIIESVLAAPAYAVALPITLVLGQARFMSCVFKLSYHVGRLLALVGANPIKEAYVTE